MDKYNTAVLDALKVKSEQYRAEGDTRNALILDNAIREAIENNNYTYMKAIDAFKWIPVTIQEFLDSPEYLGNGDLNIWPAIREDIEKMIPDTLTGATTPTEIILSGATGIGKTIRAEIFTLYTLYVLTCFDNPQEFYGLSKAKPIILGCSSANPMGVKQDVLAPVINMFLNMEYTKKNVKWNKDKIKTCLEIYNSSGGVSISWSWKPASRASYQGNDLILAVIDEVNTMDLVQNSSKATGSDDGIYDQAAVVMSEVLNRYEGRFKVPNGPKWGGILSIASSSHFDDYTTKRIRLIRSLSKEIQDETYISTPRRWDFVPKEKYPSGKYFNWLLTTREYNGRFLTDEQVANKEYPIGGEIEQVPIEHRREFETDPDTAQRDIIGRPASTVEVFIRRPEKIREAIARFNASGRKAITRSSIHGRELHNFDMLLDGMPEIIPENLPRDKHLPRIIHIDIATGAKSGKSDKCGVAMVKYRGNEAREVLPGHMENNPNYEVEMAISLIPSGGKEVMIEQVRDLALELSTTWGLNIILFSFDQHQSKESQQKIANAGFRVNQFSCRKNPESYEYLKEVLYSDRVDLPPNDLMVEEMQYLQKDPRTGKVGHSPGTHDDICDSIASALYQFTIMPGFRQIGFADFSGTQLNMRKQTGPRKGVNRRKHTNRR